MTRVLVSFLALNKRQALQKSTLQFALGSSNILRYAKSFVTPNSNKECPVRIVFKFN